MSADQKLKGAIDYSMRQLVLCSESITRILEEPDFTKNQAMMWNLEENLNLSKAHLSDIKRNSELLHYYQQSNRPTIEEHW